jgi:hypothetical protein
VGEIAQQGWLPPPPPPPGFGQSRRGFPVNPRLAAWVAGTLSLALGGLTVILSFLPAPPDPDGIPNFAYSTNRALALFIQLSLFGSAVAFISCCGFVRHWYLSLVIGVQATIGGALLWAYTLFHGTQVTAQGGATIVVQVYSQPLLLFIWGLSVVLFSPLAYFIQKEARSALGSSVVAIVPPAQAGVTDVTDHELKT